MKSAIPKVLHELCGRSLVGHVLAAARELDPENLVVVVGHAREKVTAHLAEVDAAVRTAVQEEQNGTGHAVRMGLEQLGGGVDGTVVVVCGDTPLLTGATLAQLAATHHADGNAVTVLTAEVPDATGYGRIVRDDASGAVTAIVEHKDASAAELAIREINSGVFAFDGQLLADALKKVRTDNSQGEEYLTDVLGILREAGHRVGASVAADHREIAGINNRVQLSEARRILNDRLLTAAMLSGVTVIDPATTWVDVTVTFEQDAVIHPGTQLHGSTHLGEGSKIPHLSYVGDATIGEYSNIGAASVFVNYDGQDKHHTTVGSHCRTGSDNMFVAPVTVGDGAYTAAGSVITKDVPPGSLAVARGQQRNIEGWVARKRPGSAAAKAAETASRQEESGS
jgi:bifunctional UDP-N-acetylglucosamine pyrophosphorylase/glucosamine-1-phosphate N-acetyltransferase